jgi:hypothetical protein
MNEFEDEDDNDFLVEENEAPKEESSYVIDNSQSTTTKFSEASQESQAVSNDNMINPENEKLLFEKLGKSYKDLFRSFKE